MRKFLEEILNGRHPMAFAVCVATLFIGCQPIAISQTTRPLFTAIQSQVLSATETVPLAEIDGHTVTDEEVRRWIAVPEVNIRLPGETRTATPDEVFSQSGGDVAKVVETLALYEMASREALEDDDFRSTPMQALLEVRRRNILRTRFLEIAVDAENPPMSDAEARKWYEEHLHLFTEPFRFSAYTIFLSTYKPHRMGPDDTPEAIAEEFTGGMENISRVLDKTTSEPLIARIRLFPLLPWPIQDGKVIMVPVTEEERAAVRRKMESIQQQIVNGADFVDLAIEYSDEPEPMRGVPVGPLPGPGRPILPEVLDAALKTDEGEVTPVLDTKNGFLLMKILSKKGPRVIPFAEVKDTLIQREVQNRRQQARQELFDSLFDDPVLKIDRAAMMKDGAPDGLVIARVGDFRYTWGDYRRDTGRQYSAPEEYEDRVTLLEESERLRQAIIEEKIRQMNLSEEPATKAQFEANETVLRGRAYLEWYARNRVPITEAQLRGFYNENRNEFREPGRYLVRELILKLDETELRDEARFKARQLYLEETVKPRLSSERRFEKLAPGIANWPAEESERGQLKEVPGTYRGPEFADRLLELEPEKTHGPFLVGDELFLVWVARRPETQYRPFDDVKDEVRQKYVMANWLDLMNQTEKAIRDRHSLKLLFTSENGGSE